MKLIYLVFVSVLTLMLTSCLKTRAQLESEASSSDLQRQTNAQRQSAQKDPGPRTGPHRFDEMDEQLRQINGRVDSLENSVALLNTSRQNDQAVVSKDKQTIDQRFAAHEDALRKIETQLNALSDEIAQLKAPTNTPVTSEKAKPAKNVHEEGEALFSAKKWKEAIVAYQKYRDTNPKGRLYGDATYKIGVCFQELGLKDEARAFFEEVVSKYPNSKEAKKAQFRMKSTK